MKLFVHLVVALLVASTETALASLVRGLEAAMLSLSDGGTYSKQSNRRTCAWDRCPSSGFDWPVAEGCTCIDGQDSCHMVKPETELFYFTEATLIQIQDGLWQMEATSDGLNLGEGSDCSSGGSCLDDPLRGGFRVDLTGTDYEFSADSVVAVDGWSPEMRLSADGEVVDEVRAGATGATLEITIPNGSRVVEVVCGGWCGGCSALLFVSLATDVGPTPPPTSGPAPPPTSEPAAVLEMLDKDLLEVAHAAIGLGLSPTLQSKVDSFENDRTDTKREDLKRSSMAAISRASKDQFWDLVDPQSDKFSSTLHAWNGIGATDAGNGKSRRSVICDVIGDPTAKVASDVRECMCGSDDPFVRCQLMLGNAALGYHGRRQRERQLTKAEPPATNTSQKTMHQLDRRMPATCGFESTPPDLLGDEPDLESLLKQVTGDVKGVGIKGFCAFDLQPPPLNILEVQGSVELSVPDLPWLTKRGALDAIADGSIPTDTELVEIAGGAKGKIEGKLCFALASELDKADLDVIEDILDFLGVDLCFATLSLEIWPVRGHARLEFALKFLVVLFAKAALSWQPSTELRDVLGLCDSVTPSCSNKDEFFCSMDEGEVMGSFEIGVDFFLWEASVRLDIGESAYDDCDKWEDGTLCLLGTSCNNCRNGAEYWYAKAFTACGVEPKWEDGTICGLGTTCNQCKNPATYWYGKPFTACGEEPCWNDGTICLEGTSCNACCNPSSFWSDNRFTWACGDMPCWDDGTVCLAGTTCKECCNDKSFWADSRFTFACGKYPQCWNDGTICLEGTTCGACCNPSSFWSDHRFTWACGDMPCWNDGTVCLAGTTCKECCNGYSFWSDGRFTNACGDMPCWRNVRCLAGTTCNECCDGYHWSWGDFGHFCD